MLDNLGQYDRRLLVEIVGKLLQRQEIAGALDHFTAQGRRLLRRAHAAGVVEFAVRLWINAPQGATQRAMRAAAAGFFLPAYRAEAVRRIEDALAGPGVDVSKVDRSRVLDAEYEVRR